MDVEKKKNFSRCLWYTVVPKKVPGLSVAANIFAIGGIVLHLALSEEHSFS